MTLGTKHFSSSSVKHRFPSQSSWFNHRSGKLPWTLFWCSVTVLTKQYGRRYRSYISDKMLVLAQMEQNLRQVWRVEWGGGQGIWKTYSIEKGSWSIQRCRIVGKFALVEFLGRWGKCIDNYLDIRKGEREHEWPLTVVIFFGIKIGAG